LEFITTFPQNVPVNTLENRSIPVFGEDMYNCDMLSVYLAMQSIAQIITNYNLVLVDWSGNAYPKYSSVLLQRIQVDPTWCNCSI